MKKFIMSALAVAMFTASTGYSADGNPEKSKYENMTTPQLQSELKELEAQALALVEKESLIESYLKDDTSTYFLTQKHAKKMLVGGLGASILAYVLVKTSKKTSSAVAKSIVPGVVGLGSLELSTITMLLSHTDTQEFIGQLDTMSRKEIIALKSIIAEKQSENYRKQVIIQDLLGL